MNLQLDIQRACPEDAPDDATLQRAAAAALQGRSEPAELCIRLVDAAESAELNSQYRGKNAPTNVLSFPCQADIPDWPMLGDLVICVPVVRAEALEQGKPELNHWTHLVVHGVLHLLGFDHGRDAEAQHMEALECRILAGLGIPDPYRTDGGREQMQARA